MYKADVAGALPAALWAEILQHVPQQHRLTQCALVCKGWSGAAALATVHVKQEFKAGAGAGAVPALAAFQTWLSQHAGQLLSLQLSMDEESEDYDIPYRLQLPLSRLTRLHRLELQNFKVQLPGEDGSSGSGLGAVSGDSNVPNSRQAAPSSLPSLQHLELFQVQLVSVDSLLQLTRAPQLKSLIATCVEFADVDFSSNPCSYGTTDAGVQQVAAAIPRLLQQLPLLSVLNLPNIPFTDAAVQQAAAMQGLQQIAIQHVQEVPVCDIRHLPSSITELELHGNMFHDESPSLPPELQQLSKLLRLRLTWCAVPPAVLGSVPQLRMLRLQDCTLLPNRVRDTIQTEGTAALLEALPKLTCLEDLQLDLQGLDSISIGPQHFSALTASSHLTQLRLVPEKRMPVPNGAVQHMFPAGRQMPVLQELRISPRFRAGSDEWCIDSGDIRRISSCCPRLQGLEIMGSVRPGADLSGLLQLPKSCVSLFVGGAAFTDEAASILAQLTQLKHLVWGFSHSLTDAGLEQLVRLDLEKLQVVWSGVSKEASSQQSPGCLVLEWDPVAELSVSEQLDALCDRSPVCAPARLRRHKEAAAAREQHLHLEISSLHRQLQHSQAEVERLKQQLEAAQAGLQ